MSRTHRRKTCEYAQWRMNQSVYSDNGSDSKKDNDDDISERTESVREKKSEKGVGVLVTGHSVLGLKPILLWKEETDLARWIQNCFQSTWACLYGPL